MTRILPKQYAKILYESTKGLKGKDLDQVIEGFVQLLKQKQMITKVDYIIKEFETYAKKEDGVEMLEITSAREMSKEEVIEVSKHFGEKVETSVKVDPTLIGGITVRTENTILDGSIKTQLERLKQQL